MNRTLDFIDNAILDHIAVTSRFCDVQLARDWGIPRMRLLDHLRYLTACGYVTRQGEAFSLTEDGQKERIPLRNVHQAVPEDKTGEAAYVWDYLYIPQKGWSGD